MAVSRRLRYEVLRRDNHTCRYCGASAPEVKLTVDHVTASALGGKDEASNLVTACGPCNSGKSSTTADSPLVEDVAADALRWAHARTVVLDEWQQGRRELAYDFDQFAAAWDGWTYGTEGNQKPVPREAGWEDSIERWLHEGLTVDDLVLLIPKAMRNNKGRAGRPVAIESRWTYYCGVVWRTLDGIEDATKAQFKAPESEFPDTEDPISDPTTVKAAHRYGFAVALRWAHEYAADDGERYPCLNCPDTAYGCTGYCLRCWVDAIDKDMEYCRICRVLFHRVDIDQREASLPRCESCNEKDVQPDLEPF